MFEVVLLSLEWWWGLLALNIIPIFFENNVMKKTKRRSIKNIWTAGHCIQPKWHKHGCSRSEIVVKQIFNLDCKLYFLQKYIVCKSQVEIGHMFMEISLNLADSIGFFKISIVYHFVFTFFKECFLTLSLLLNKACVV